MKGIKYFLSATSLLLSINLSAQNNGVLSSGASYSADVPSVFSSNTYSVALNGTANGKVVATTSFAVTDAQSISLWFKMTTSDFTSQPVLFGNPNSTAPFLQIVGPTDIRIRTDGGTYFDYSFGTSITLSVWHNIILNRISGGTARIYIDGTESYSGSQSIGTSSLTIQNFGVWFDGGSGGVLTGKMAEIRKFESTLTSTDISNLATGLAPVTTSSLHWKMNEGTGTTVYDDLTGAGGTNASWITSGNNIYNTNTGNIGIGTINPHEKLSVDGTVLAKQVKVSIQSTDWSDYVFHKNYKLPSLIETEKFIKLHEHLKGLPSANEVEKNGLDVGNNQALLLKKIEELTLYIINQNKRIHELEKRINTNRK